MLLKSFYDRALAQTSYLIGDQAAGVALVVDPARDVTPYLAAARDENLTITQIAETHIHADYVGGSPELAARTGARLYLSAMGGADWLYAFADETTVLLRDGDHWMIGSVRLDVIHTPGHSPEHLIFQITDTAQTGEPFGLLTGDCLFVGDMGRPDLLETAAGVVGTMRQGASQQFANMQRFKTLPDYLQVFPGHGAGSACGKALGALPSSTIGYEKRVNPAFQFTDETAFVNWLLSGQPETPRYFAQMKRVNRAGAALLDTLDTPLPAEGFVLEELLRNDAFVIDARPDGSHIPGALHIEPGDKFSTYAGWFVDYAAPTYLIADKDDAARLISDLRAIGVDNLPSIFLSEEIDYLSIDLPTISIEDAASRDDVLFLDVRGESEYTEERIAGARHIFYGALPERLDELPRDRMIVTYCSSGMRSKIALSLLIKHGFPRFANMRGGLQAWKAAGFAVERG